MILLSKEAFEASEAALDFAIRYVDNPVHQRAMIGAVWNARGYTVVSGVPVPIGTNITYTLGDNSWKQEWLDKWEDAVARVLGSEATAAEDAMEALEQEKQHAALQAATDEDS